MIRQIIFDFGNVLIPLQFGRTKRLLKLYRKRPKVHAKEMAFFAEYEVGKISTSEFLTGLSRFYNSKPKKMQWMWNSLIGNFPLQNIELLQELKTEYDLYLLSNINDLHEKHIQQKMGRKNYEQFLSCFDVVYYSHKVGLRKPDAKIFTQVLTENGLVASECLFIDDTAINIESAQKLGIETWHFKKSDRIEKIWSVLEPRK